MALMTIFASCGHRLPDEADLNAHCYWWESDEGLAYGVLCDPCVPIYRATTREPAWTWDDVTDEWADSVRLASVGG